MIEKIIFMGDPCRGEQVVNVEKIRHLFTPLFNQMGIFTETFASQINQNTDRNIWVAEWKASLSTYPIPVSASFDLERVAVIGFETPESELNYLSQHNVPWINLCIHPLRFLDDLYFEVTTSLKYDMKHISAGLGLIEYCVKNISNHFTTTAHQSKKNTLLICGQDWIDRSIYFDEEFRQLPEFFPQIDLLSKDYDRIIYKPHPAWHPTEILDAVTQRYQAELCTNSNIYQVFITEKIDTVCAISSSVLTEAPYFGVKDVFLEPRAKRYGPPISYRALVDDNIFWQNFLLDKKESSTYLKISAVIPENHLRRTFYSWGFITDQIRSDNRVAHIEAVVAQAESNSVLAIAQAQQAESNSVLAIAQAQQAESNSVLAIAQAQQAESNSAHASSQAQQAESNSVLAIAQAQQAESNSAYASSQAQQAESNSVLAIAQAHQAESNSAHAIAHAVQVESFYQQEMEIKENKLLALTQKLQDVHQANHHHWLQLEQTRKELRDVHQANHHHWLQLEQTRKELRDVHQANHHHWQLAEQRQNHLEMLQRSWSWRLTSPLRLAAALSLRPLQTSKSLGNQTLAWALNTFQKPLTQAMAWVLAKPQLTSRINRWLLRWPHLHGHLLAMASRNGVINPALDRSAPDDQALNDSGAASQTLAQLSPRARQIYADLKAAIDQQHKGGH